MADEKKYASLDEWLDETLGSMAEKMKADRGEEADEKLRETLLEAMECLTPVEDKVIRLRYGIDADKSLDVSETAKECGLSKRRVEEIEQKALLKLMHPEKAGRSNDGPAK